MHIQSKDMAQNRLNELRIDALLKERGMTKVELARRIGTSKENLNGKLKSPSYPTLSEIADALEVDMWELFADREGVIGDGADEMTVTCPHCGKPVTIKGVVK